MELLRATVEHPETWVAVGDSYRSNASLDYPVFLSDSWAVEDIVLRVAESSSNQLIMGGCEPTLRRDLPQLVSALAEAGDHDLGMWTDGLALQTASVVKGLKGLGLTSVRIPFYSGRADAHDWVAGTTGASRRVVKAIRLCVEQGLRVDVDTVITRPTMALLSETVEVARRLGVASVHLRAPHCRGDWQEKFVAIAPRYGFLFPYLSDLQSSPTHPITLRGFPRCVVPDNLQYIGGRAVRWLDVDEESEGEKRAIDGCKLCVTHPDCSGPPKDYIERYGWTEIRSQENLTIAATAARIPIEAGAIKPPPRAGRIPPTRLHFSVTQSRRATLGGDPLLGLQEQSIPESIRVTFGAPSRIKDQLLGDHLMGDSVESTRDIRLRLVKMSQQGASYLRIASAGSLAHPEVAGLLRECRRLSIEEVEVCGEGSGLAGMTDREIRRLRGVRRFLFALYGADEATHDSFVEPGSFAKALNIAERLAKLIKSEVGFFGVISSVAQLRAFDRAWMNEQLPGEPRFRLAPSGGSLNDLARALEDCSEPVRNAVIPMLPLCIFPRDQNIGPAPVAELAFGDLPMARRKPSACDIRGAYNACQDSCQCSDWQRCPGVAEGWALD